MSTEILSLDPSSTMIRLLATTGIKHYKTKKREQILKALEQGKLSIDSNEVKSEEFIAAYLATEDALIKSSSKSKFDFLVNLFIQGSNSGRIDREPDAYQEVLSIVNELSERELKILYHLYNYEISHGEMQGQLSRKNADQVQYLVQATGLQREHIIALLVRLRRTGLIITYGEKSEKTDLMLSGLETMCISPIANEIKEWVFNIIEGVFHIES